MGIEKIGSCEKGVKLSCCLIVRDESSTLRPCLKSLRPHVDELVVVDTGSKDDTPAIARDFADKFDTFTDCNDSDGLIWDFALARNYSFGLATHEWVYWADGDDLVRGAEHLRGLCNTDGAAIYMMPYEYTHDETGKVTCIQWRERLVRPRESFRWVTPCHEVLVPQGSCVPAVLHSQDVVNVHRIERSKKPREPNRNLRILDRYVKGPGRGDVRAWYYLGVEYARRRDFGSAMTILRHYTSRSDWSDEKCLGLLEMAQMQLAIGDYEAAIEWALKATATKSWSEPYWVIAHACYELAMKGHDSDYNWNRCRHFGELGLAQQTETVLFVNPQERHEIQRYLNVAYLATRDYERAAESCRAGLAGLPGDEGLSKNLKACEREIRKRTIQSLLDSHVAGGDLKDESKRIIEDILNGKLKVQLLEAAPERANDNAGVRELGAADDGGVAAEVAPIQRVKPVAQGGGALSTLFFSGPALERWSPVTIDERGIGGSETMLWEMARRLAKLGHRVVHYGDCDRAQEGNYEGVEWKHWEGAEYPREVDVLISSRRAEFVDAGIKSKASLLWVHDVHCGPALTRERAAQYTRILALSQWHKSLLHRVYPLLSDGKIVVTRNGIDLSRFDVPVAVRFPHRAVYSSSPDRGLLTAVECWPRIRRRVPEAQLHIFYGFDNWEATIRATNDDAQWTSVKQLREIIEKTEGVFLRGRVSQRELAKEFLMSGVWAYPTWFSETSCITAMEAQAAGLFAVTSPIAALTETCGDSTAFVDGDWRSEDYKRAWSRAMIDAMTTQHDREAVRAGARRFCLDALAREWDAMLRGLVQQGETSELPKFEEWVA